MEKRNAIIELHLAGISAPLIIRQLKVAKLTVYDTIKNTKKLVEPGTKINTECYIKEILSPALIKMKKHLKNKVFTFQ